nr:PDZ domain-containing protein [candidate division Zixibacteria bacterium]
MRSFISALALALFIGAAAQAEEARLLRFPAVHGDNVAFVYAGDIYTAPRAGGAATRLTSHPGLEIFPRFSPDGAKIAFTGQYDGDMAVYVIPVAGGQPQRLTWHPGLQRTSERMGPENVVMGWNRDGSKVLFRSRKESKSDWEGRTYLVDLKGGMPEPLPMASAGFTSLSPDERKAAYCPIYRDFRTWKRYKGGMAQDVWIYDMEKNVSEKITDWEGTDNVPMWYGDRIYFNSDRTGKLNLYRYDLTTGQVTQVTSFTEYDVRWPSLGDDGIAFENGGYLYVLDLPGEKVAKVSVEVISDRHAMRPEIMEVSDKIGDYDIAPNGKRAVFAARGDIFTVPAKEGNTRALLARSEAREKSVRWSPDGKWIAFYSDISGEEELYLVAHDGSDTVQLTSGNRMQRNDPEWSPDSRMLAFVDMTEAICCVDAATGRVETIDSAEFGGLGGLAWSPDSRYLAYNKAPGVNRIRTIFIYSFDDRRSYQITPGFTHDYSPVFSADGKYLFFISERNFNPILGSYEFSFVNQAIEDLYLIILQSDGASPFRPGQDEGIAEKTEAGAGGEQEKKGKDRDGGPPPEPVKVRIDIEGIFDRQVAFDLPAGNYGNLAALDGAVLYMSFPIRGLRGPVTHDDRTLHKYDLKKKKDYEFARDIGGYRLSADRKCLLVDKDRSYFIVGADGNQADLSEGRLDLSHLSTRVDHVAEYRQMLREVWRGERDFFYDPAMHGVDWDKMWDRYAALLPYAANRYDLTYVIGEMIGELACSHTYTGGGEYAEIPRGKVGLLGADFAVDKISNRYRIARIFRGENFDDDLRSPLTEPGVNIREGEYLLAIDGRELTADIDPYQLTENSLGQRVTLTVN